MGGGGGQAGGKTAAVLGKGEIVKSKKEKKGEGDNSKICPRFCSPVSYFTACSYKEAK